MACIFSSAGLAETLHLGRGQCSCSNGRFLHLSDSIQLLLVTVVAGIHLYYHIDVQSFYRVFGNHLTCFFWTYQHFSNQTRSNMIQHFYAFFSFATLHRQLFFFFCGIFLFPGQCCLPCIRNGQSIIFVSSLGVWTFDFAAVFVLSDSAASKESGDSCRSTQLTSALLEGPVGKSFFGLGCDGVSKIVQENA